MPVVYLDVCEQRLFGKSLLGQGLGKLAIGEKKRNTTTPYKESQGLQKGTLTFMQCGGNFLAHAHSYVYLYVMYIISYTRHTILLQKRTLKVK